MSALEIREAGERDLANWDRLAGSFDNHRVFHTRGWLGSIEASSGAAPLHLLMEKRGRVVGCLPGFLRRLGPLRLFGSPLEGWQTDSMGPVYDPRAVSTREMFSTLVEYLERRHGAHHIELASPHLDAAEMSALGFESRPLFTYRIPLWPGDEERVMKQIHSRTRTTIRQALRRGLRAEVETDEAFVDEFYDQTRQVYTRRGKTVPFTHRRALEFFRGMKASGNLLAISVRLPDGGPVAATGLFMTSGRELHLWNWTHRTEHGNWHPTELLTWTAMVKAMERGCETFDLCGGGDAKLKFGAVADESNRRWIRSRYRWLGELRSVARGVYRWQQSARGRVARALSR